MAGKSILESQMKTLHGVLVVGLKKGDGVTKINPGPEMLIQGGDIIIFNWKKQLFE